MNNSSKVKPYEYLTGEAFVDRLKEALGCKSHQELSDILDIPKSTFSTWSRFDRTSHELMVRLHLSKGIPIEELALKNYTPVGRTYDLPPAAGLFTIQSHSLENGLLEFDCLTPITQDRLDKLGLHIADLIEIQDTTGIYLINRQLDDAVSGRYLIEIDGRNSINQVQRLPGKKLAIAFSDRTIEVPEEDIKVVGKVVVTMKKE